MPMYELNSCEVFPKIYSDNQRNILIWDNSLWKIYNRFLAGYILFIESFKNDDETMLNKAIKMLTMATDVYLALRFKKSRPFLSCSFLLNASMDFLLSKQFPQLNLPEEFSERFKRNFSFAQLFCLYHEITHYLCKHEQKNNVYEAKKVLDSMIANLEKQDADLLLHWFGKDINEFKKIYNIKKNDILLHEELYCDQRSFLLSYRMHRDAYHSIQSPPVLGVCLDAFEQFTFFHTILTYMEGCWRAFDDEHLGIISDTVALFLIDDIISINSIRMGLNETCLRLLLFKELPNEYKSAYKYINGMRGPYIPERDCYNGESLMRMILEETYLSENRRQAAWEMCNKMQDADENIDEMFQYLLFPFFA